MIDVTTLREFLSGLVSSCFHARGYDPKYGIVSPSARPDFGQFQCNGPLTAAKEYRTNPRKIADDVSAELAGSSALQNIFVAGPGFINMTLADTFLTDHVSTIGERMGVQRTATPEFVIVDYGGANIAKPLHVGHLRAGIIGEALKRMARFLGHNVIGDVHLGDWGLQMGMVIDEIRRLNPGLPYFDSDYSGPYPVQAPVSAEELEQIYPIASARCDEDVNASEMARITTRELQNGRPGYRALWQKLREVSVADLRKDYESLNIEFDLWLGESDTQEYIPTLIDHLVKLGFAERSQGALVIRVNDSGDTVDLPPLILAKSNGASLYGTTDLATIDKRVEEFNPDLILYVVDNRQADHFKQVFRAARKTDIAPEAKTKLEHVGFGTMNGPDGKPFKTRAGGVMKLKELIYILVEKALERMDEAEIARGYTLEEKQRIAEIIGVSALKFGDLINKPSKDYVFDLDRFASFEGKTGPYLLYSAVRIKSILRKAKENNIPVGPLGIPVSDIERSILLKLAAFPDTLSAAFQQRGPHILCGFSYELASDFSSFYREHHILREKNHARQSSWLELAKKTLTVIELSTRLLGIELPDRM